MNRIDPQRAQAPDELHISSLRARIFSQESAVHLTFLLLCLLPVAAAPLFSTDGTANTVHVLGTVIPVRVPCLLRSLTGYRCPACGMTRSFIYMSRLNFPAALRMNPAGVPLYLLCLYEIPLRAALLLRSEIPLRRFFIGIERILLVIVCVVDAGGFILQFFI